MLLAALDLSFGQSDCSGATDNLCDGARWVLAPGKHTVGGAVAGNKPCLVLHTQCED